VVLEDFIPRLAGAKATILTQLDRITQRGTDFFRANPIVSTATIGAGLTGLAVAVSTIRKRTKKKKRKKKAKKRTTRKRATTRIKKKKRITHRSPRHKGHKFVTFTTKDGKKVKFLVSKKGSPSHRRRRKKT